ncbi:hypothetical protein [Pseudomonas jessenii]|uniref:hypothetical protein n=1 Tax=Pseudomonas jessenii TaxID=77298 RepID=UPI00389253C7
MSKRPIKLNVFLHEDLKGINEDLLHQDYFDWLADTVSRISDRTMDVNLIQPSDALTLSSFNYKSDNIERLMDKFQDALLTHLGNQDRTTYDASIDLYLLLTRDDINKTTLGVAQQPGVMGIASITSKLTASHEVGHMLNAAHEDSDENVSTYYGTYKSIMYKTARKSAFTFSKKNEENIRNYLIQFP